jgi:hypothetical protein
MNMDHSHVIKNITGYIVLDDDNVSVVEKLSLIKKKKLNILRLSRFPRPDRIFIKSAIAIHIQAVIRVTPVRLTAVPIP